MCWVCPRLSPGLSQPTPYTLRPVLPPLPARWSLPAPCSAGRPGSAARCDRASARIAPISAVRGRIGAIAAAAALHPTILSRRRRSKLLRSSPGQALSLSPARTSAREHALRSDRPPRGASTENEPTFCELNPCATRRRGPRSPYPNRSRETRWKRDPQASPRPRASPCCLVDWIPAFAGMTPVWNTPPRRDRHTRGNDARLERATSPRASYPRE
jgi:hypothetical protein